VERDPVSPTERSILNVALDQSTFKALQEFCDEQGVTASALVEAFARAVTSDRNPPQLSTFVTEARKIAAQRRRRR
jgi:hypothetical protein